MKEGIITKLISGEYTVLSDHKLYVCKPRGLFRHTEQSLKVGDHVVFEEETRIITEVQKRKNELVRPVIANVDQVFLVFSVAQPDLNTHLLDRLLSIVEYNDIRAIIVFTKLDLLVDKQSYQIVRDYYQQIGYTILEFKKDAAIDETFYQHIDHNISVLAGQSGVGKSTILNHLDSTFTLKTDIISKALNRGKHTTRHVELLPVRDGFIADTPGFGIASFDEMDFRTFSDTFVEFFALRSQCRFTQCIHENEPGCAVKKAVESKEILPSRYENYLNFMKEIKEVKQYKY